MQRVDHPRYHHHMEEQVEVEQLPLLDSLHLLGNRREVVPHRTIRLVVGAGKWRHHRPLVAVNNNNNNNKGAPTITAIRAKNLVPFGLKVLAEMATTANLVTKDHLAVAVEERVSTKTAVPTSHLAAATPCQMLLHLEATITTWEVPNRLPTIPAIRAKDLVPFGLKVLAEMATTANLLMKDHLAAEEEEERASTKTATVVPTSRLAAATQCQMLLRLVATITTWVVPNRLPTTARLVPINPIQQHLLLEPGLPIPIRLQAPSADLHLVRKEGLGRQHRVRRLLAVVVLVAGLQPPRLLEVLHQQLRHRLEVLLQQLHRLLVVRHPLHRLLVALLHPLHRRLVARHPRHRLLGDLPAGVMAETPQMRLPLVEVAGTKTREVRLLVTQHRLSLHLAAIKILKILSMAVVEEAEATSKVVLEETTKTPFLEEVAVGATLAINDQAGVSLAPFGLQAVADTVTTVDFPTRDPPEVVVVAAVEAVAVAVVISRLVVAVSVGITTHLLVGQDDKKRATMEFCSLMGAYASKKMLSVLGSSSLI
jgi:hypothetical protein